MATRSNTAGQSDNVKNSERGVNNSPGNGSGTAAKESVATSSSRIRRATGPRTKEGKEKSKHNALKHRIFASVILLDTEFGWQFKSLLRGLRNEYKPEGMLEGILVEKLASLIWRYRRMLIAEQAVIQRGTECFWWDELVRQNQEATIFLKGQNEGKTIPGLMLGRTNPFIREMCVELLQLLKRFIETRGFDSECDFRILRTVYGDSSFAVVTYCTVAIYYSQCMRDSQLTEQQRLKSGRPAPNECKASFIEELEKQIEALEKDGEVVAKARDQKEALEARCHNVPEGPQLDRLLRYEANLDRSFDRTLAQLERLQRIRLGHPVPPPINVNVSSS
jgi:hypothetical protein